MLTIQELRSSTVKELQQELKKARAEMLKIRISTRTKQEKNTSKVKKQKYYVALILTALKEAQGEEKAVTKEDKQSKK